MMCAAGWKRAGIVIVVMLLCARADQDVRLNEIQVLHAHNSYHLAPEESIADIFDSRLIQALLSEDTDIDLQQFAQASQYSYPSVFHLLDVWGVRSLEFDCFYDPEGGHYSHPAARKIAGSQTPFPTEELNVPGWKLLHIPDIDFNSTCWTLISCLREVRRWSTRNEDHLPIFISIEPSTYEPESILGESLASAVNGILARGEGLPTELTPSVPIDRAAIRSLLSEIESVFDVPQIITPSEIKGNASNLREAITTHGWPLLSSLRGRVLFIMSPVYTDNLLAVFPSLQDSPVFPSAYEDRIDNENTLFIAVRATEPALPSNRSEWNATVDALVRDVRSLVDDGYIVRAFADYGTKEARHMYVTRRDRVIKAGTHLVATDYPGGLRSDAFESNYTVQLPGGNLSVCNPQTASAQCQSIHTVASISTDFSPPQPPSHPSHDSRRNDSASVALPMEPQPSQEIEFITDSASNFNVVLSVLFMCVTMNIVLLLQ